MKSCYSFGNAILFSILNELQSLWPIIRVSKSRHSIFKLASELVDIQFQLNTNLFLNCFCFFVFIALI